MKLQAILIFLILSPIGISQIDSAADELPYTFPMIIRYENNKAEINHINRIRLGNLAEYMIAHPNFKIVIEGHVCCNPPNAKRVSKRRAKFVWKYLKKLKVPLNQMQFIGRSFDAPIIPKEKNEADKDINRRVEIKVASSTH